MNTFGGLLAWVSREDGQAALIGAAVLAAALTAIITLFRQPVVARPLRWFGRKLGAIGRVLIGDPLENTIKRALDHWAQTVWEPRISNLETSHRRQEAKVDEVLAQFSNNGGSTMRDRVDAVASATGAPPAPRVGPPPDDAE